MYNNCHTDRNGEILRTRLMGTPTPAACFLCLGPISPSPFQQPLVTCSHVVSTILRASVVLIHRDNGRLPVGSRCVLSNFYILPCTLNPAACIILFIYLFFADRLRGTEWTPGPLCPLSCAVCTSAWAVTLSLVWGDWPFRTGHSMSEPRAVEAISRCSYTTICMILPPFSCLLWVFLTKLCVSHMKQAHNCR